LRPRPCSRSAASSRPALGVVQAALRKTRVGEEVLYALTSARARRRIELAHGICDAPEVQLELALDELLDLDQVLGFEPFGPLTSSPS